MQFAYHSYLINLYEKTVKKSILYVCWWINEEEKLLNVVSTIVQRFLSQSGLGGDGRGDPFSQFSYTACVTIRSENYVTTIRLFFSLSLYSLDIGHAKLRQWSVKKFRGDFCTHTVCYEILHKACANSNMRKACLSKCLNFLSASYKLVFN